jgi:restriction system protein
MSLLLALQGDQPIPGVTLKAVLVLGEPDKEGALVQAVALPWFEILKMIQQDPQGMYGIDPRRWEEILAGAYTRAGFDEVILTPRSGDKGRDVVATKRGIGSIRIFDQVKAYAPGNLVTADQVRGMIGVITGAANVSKGSLPLPAISRLALPRTNTSSRFFLTDLS